jgi:Ca-activated chloride channel family protein
MLLVVVAATISIVALPGPVWKQLPQPVFREESALVVALDLSQSMRATDVKPSRLERAKLKVLDLIKARKGGQTALIVYAATAFTVTPLTDDDNTIANLVPALQPELMPAQGSNIASALSLASELLGQAGVKRGDVLLVTDAVADAAAQAIDALTTDGHRLSIIGVGTAEGGPIPLSGGFLTDASGAIVIPRLESTRMQQAAFQGNGIYVNMRADDSDIDQLTALFSSQPVKTDSEATDLTADIWREEGPWLLLLVLPLVALWPRRGWLLGLAMLTLPLPQPAHALGTVDTDNLWLRQDQRAMQAFESGDAETAAELFVDEQWKAAAHYRAGNYQQSNELIAAPETSTDFYNKGNALAKLGDFPNAIKAYDQALAMNPDNEDPRFNRELVQQALEKQQQGQQRDGQQQASAEQQSQQQSQDQQQASEDRAQDQAMDPAPEQPQSGDPQQHPQQQDQLTDVPQNSPDQDLQSKEQQAQAEEQQDDTEQQPLQAQQQQEAIDKDHAKTVESEQAMEQWLRRIPDDPGGLMRRKFIYQYRQMPNQAEAQEPW